MPALDTRTKRAEAYEPTAFRTILRELGVMRSNPRALSFGIDCVALPVRRTDPCKGLPHTTGHRFEEKQAQPHQGNEPSWGASTASR